MKNKKVSFKIKVLIPIITIFTLSVLIISFINYRLLDASVESKTNANLEIFADSIIAQMKHLEIILETTKQTLNEKHIAIAKTVGSILDNTRGELTTEELLRIAEPLDIIEINIANADGIITNSSIPRYIGFDYKSTEVTSVYMALTDGTRHELSEEPRASMYDGDLGDINHFTGITRAGGGFIQLGFNANVIRRLQEEINITKTISEKIIGENGYGMVFMSGLITAHPNKTFIGRDVTEYEWYETVNTGSGFTWVNIDNTHYYAGYKNTDGHTIIGLVPEADFHRERNQLFLESLRTLILALIVMAIIVYFVLSRLLIPVKTLVYGIEKIAGGDLDARMEGNYNDEFDKIKDAVNTMAADIKTHMDERIKAEHKLSQELIAIIKTQIQPHFLYNVLSVIKYFCVKDPKKAEETVVEFAEYLRGNLDSLVHNELITFDKEFHQVENYLKIEKKRFEERLNIVYNIKARNFMLPVLTLQPIVEIAVRYGITKAEDGGTITISTEETINEFIITVNDDGAGFDTEQEKRIHDGINKVRNRLLVMCQGILDIQNKEGHGTTAIISIPKKERIYEHSCG
ncbi:MAG: histidine kinase [Treponema sp.]|nr:histidine kinase [Treponema sp.]